MASTPHLTPTESRVDLGATLPPQSAAVTPGWPFLRWTSNQRCSAVLLLASVLHCSMTAWLALARYHSVHNRTFDLALHGRMAWGIVRGQWVDPIAGGHLLSGHLPLVLCPLAGLGALLGTVPVLLVAQSVAVAAAAWPLSRLAARRLGPGSGLVVGLAWLLYPNLGHVATYEMHPGTLAVWPLCAAFDALDQRRPGAFAWLCALVIACRASLALSIGALGLVALWRFAGMRRAGAWVALGSLAYLAFVQLWLSPRFGSGLGASLDLHFGRWGGSPAGVLGALFTRPAEVIQHFVAPRRLSYLVRVLAPLAFLPLLRPRLLLCALPTLALNLISEFPTTTELYSHYLTPAVPALVAAAVEGLARLPRRRLAHAALAAAAGIASVVRGGLPWSADFAAGDFRVDANSRAAIALLARIPAGASVQAPDGLLPHLCERRSVYRAPPPDRGAQYVALDISHRRRFARSEDLLRTMEEPLTRRWLARSDYGLVEAAGDLLLLHRGQSPRAGVAARYVVADLVGSGAPAIALTPCLALTRARLGSRLELQLVARMACPADLALRWGAEAAATRVDLLFDGLLSPAQLQAGDRAVSSHDMSADERAQLSARGLYVGVLRADGRPPQLSDPRITKVPLDTSAQP